MKRQSLLDHGFFKALNFVLDVFILNLFFILTVLLTSGLFFAVGLIALYAMLLDLKQGQEIQMVRRYFGYLKAGLGFGLKIMIIIAPLLILGYLNMTVILYIGETMDHGVLYLVLLFIYIFVALLMIIIFMQMFLYKANHITVDLSLRDVFNRAFFLVMKDVKRFILMFVSLGLFILFLWYMPIMILFGTMAAYSYLTLHFYHNDYDIPKL